MPTSRDLDTAEYMALGDARPPLAGAVQVDIFGLTHRGKVRPTNEDHFLTARASRSLETLQTNLAAGQVPARFQETAYGLVVADGVGGSAAGEVASSLAISVGINLALNSPKWNLKPTPEEIKENMEKWRHRFRQIDCILTDRAEADPALTGMSTTLTVAVSVGTDLVLYYVGDSRGYLLRRGRLLRLTRDHTMAQALADAGYIDPTAVETHRLRHVLTRALGRTGGDVTVEIQHMHLVDGDRVLVCTDGLTEMVPDETIAAILNDTPSSTDACQALLQRALDAGGRDNVTIALAGYTIPAQS
jgi:protein phosphatase